MLRDAKKSIALFAVLSVFISSCSKDEEEEIIDNEPRIDYPIAGNNGENVLFKSRTEFLDYPYSLSAELENDASLEIKIASANFKPDSVNSYFTFRLGTIQNWVTTVYDFSDGSQIFKSVSGDMISDLEIRFDTGVFAIEYYENGSDTISFQKEITVSKGP